jgi:hypothetical protein
MSLTYAPAPDLSDLTGHQRGAIYRRLTDLLFQLNRVVRPNECSAHDLRDILAFMTVVWSTKDYAGMRLAIDLWERLPVERRQWVQQRAEELRSPQEIAAHETTAHLEYHLAHAHDPEPIPANARPKERLRIKRMNERQAALDKAYRIELRRRRHPHLQLVWVNDNPREASRDPAEMVGLMAETVGLMTDALRAFTKEARQLEEGGE